MIIKDLIVGEEIRINGTLESIEEAERRVAIHNSEFTYRHRGHHYPEHAIYEIINDEIIIRRVK